MSEQPDGASEGTETSETKKLLDPSMEYFPDADHPAVAPFAIAFVKLMFAHASLDERIRDLLEVITGELGFGERPENLWSARQRPRHISKLMEQAKLGATAPAHQVFELLDRAIGPSDRRNLLVHGIWWRFDPEKQTISVRGGTNRSNEDQHVEMTVSEIEAVADVFLNIEAELYKLKAPIVAAIITVSPERTGDLLPELPPEEA